MAEGTEEQSFSGRTKMPGHRIIEKLTPPPPLSPFPLRLGFGLNQPRRWRLSHTERETHEIHPARTSIILSSKPRLPNSQGPVTGSRSGGNGHLRQGGSRPETPAPGGAKSAGLSSAAGESEGCGQIPAFQIARPGKGQTDEVR